jgi:AcrR family transcriptional regulator
MSSLTADLMSRLHATDANDDRDFFERERAGMLAYLAHLRANPAYLRLAGEIELHEPKLYRRAVADWLERIATRIRDGIVRGDLRPMHDAEVAAQAYFMLGASQFLDHRVRRDDHPHPRDEVIVDAYLALLRGGLGRQVGKHPASVVRAAAPAGPTPRTGRRLRQPSRASAARR